MSEPALFTSEQLWMPGFIANPYPTYHHLRDHSPLLCMTLPAGAFAGVKEPIRLWALMTHADVSRALRDRETFVSGHSPLAGTAYPKLALIQDDPPRHTQLRRLVNQAFTPKRIAALGPWITRVANALLEAIDWERRSSLPKTRIMLNSSSSASMSTIRISKENLLGSLPSRPNTLRV